jgi:hypothetical protein
MSIPIAGVGAGVGVGVGAGAEKELLITTKNRDSRQITMMLFR